MRTKLVLALLLGCWGCSDEGAELFVDLRTDLAPGREFSGVTTELARTHFDTPMPGPVGAPRDHVVRAGLDYVGGTRIAEWSGLEPGSYWARVTLRDAAGAPVVSRLARVQIRGRVVLTIVLTRDCRGVRCPPEGGDASLEACIGGRCVDPECSPEQPERCAAPECASDAECPTLQPCAPGQCVEGVCFNPPDDPSCGTGFLCDADRGCVVAESELDGGEADAGAPDAGTEIMRDAGPTDTGTCVGEETDCGDGMDEDCDGRTDCVDPGCADLACGAAGLLCRDSTCQCPIAASEVDCENRTDDDCDGEVDCADSECDGDPCGPSGQTCAAGACTCRGTGGADPEGICTDGVDDDCDGQTDCEDADCGARSCGTAGQICSSGSCTCPTGTRETACTGFADEDCDGATDCADSECEGMSCGPLGVVCRGSACVCPGGSMETACSGGADDDCDGLADCGDPDCMGVSCGPFGLACLAGVCGCAGGTMETDCTNALDDDCDGAGDCGDADCDTRACDGRGRVCTGGTCVCPGGGTETMCGDGLDEDCDRDTDCADSDCTTRSCGPDGRVCAGGACVCPGGATETNCTNGADDDCDATTDCADSDCTGAACDDGLWCNGSDFCAAGSCSDHRSPPCAMFCNEMTMTCAMCLSAADCGTVSYGPWSGCSYPTACAESTTESRTVTTPVCSSGMCSTSVSSETRPCVRDTDGTSCGTVTFGPWGACGGFAGTCDEDGTQSRSVMTPTCTAGSCTTVTSTATQACTRDTDGTTCMATSCGAYGTCSYSGACDETGTQSRTCTDYRCATGACRSSTRSESRSCSRTVANGTACSGCGATSNAWCSCCSGSCVSLQRTATCGACGVNCSAVGSCMAVNGGWACGDCNTNAECQTLLSSSATCYDTTTAGTDFCNCQCTGCTSCSCPGAGCGSNFYCHDISGHNWCARFP